MTSPRLWPLCLSLSLLASTGARGAERADILIADFEGKDFGQWKVTGTAFGPGPARGTLPNQMPVSGFKGKGLVNSYHGGDKSTGTLTSPAFKIERRYINFLVGGGKYPGQTCMNLLVAGKTVRTATGPNDRPGGSEHLDWHTWDVRDFAGKNAVIAIIDSHTGGWGHILVDHIIQSDRKLQAEPATRTIDIAEPYLSLPVKTGGPMRRMRFVQDGKTVREFEIELADAEPSFWAFSDVTAFKGQKLRIELDALPPTSKGLTAITQGKQITGTDPLYRERHRPLLHFTSRRGWLNDPNGLVFYKGEYHLFYQHNPYGWSWGNMHWGHAVSKDLIHWQELPIALYPRRFGDWCFSGSAVVDARNTSGFKTGDEAVLVAAYTSTGRGECIAYSNDRGRSWTEYSGNPVVKHAGRDPKLIWHEPTRQWVMAVYDEHQGKRWIAFHNSPDLKTWSFRSRIEDFFECPDLFELPVQGEKDKKKWVLHAADGKYVLGAFDGKSFTVESGKHQLWHGQFYAAQSFSDAPNGRRIQIGWGNGVAFPGMPFNQQMTIPCQLTLRPTPDGVRMFAEPVKEIDTLHDTRHSWRDRLLKPGNNLLQELAGDLFEIRAELAGAGADSFGFTIRGVPVVYDVKKRTIACKGLLAPLATRAGKIRLRLVIDRGSFEIFGNDGAVAMSVAVIPADNNKSLGVFTRGGNTRVAMLDVFVLKSAWEPK
jgi:fructan beta-fructosidase